MWVPVCVWIWMCECERETSEEYILLFFGLTFEMERAADGWQDGWEERCLPPFSMHAKDQQTKQTKGGARRLFIFGCPFSPFHSVCVLSRCGDDATNAILSSSVRVHKPPRSGWWLVFARKIDAFVCTQRSDLWKVNLFRRRGETTWG